jgi:hypothetical protein
MEEFLASLLGALVGGLLALLGVALEHRLQRSREKKLEQKMVRGFLQAMLTELDTCWSRAKETVNPVLESLPHNKPFASEVFINTDFFTVYHNNSHMLGRVEDDDLRQMIVATCTRYKALVETYNVNTQFYLKWQETANDYYRDKTLGWAATLKHDHYKLKEQIEELLPRLRKAIQMMAAT